MSKRIGLCVLLSLFIFLLSIPVSSHAQTAGTGLVLGTVTDASGATIVGATVTLKDRATGTERTATTNDAGKYSFPNVPPGMYDVTVTKNGFRQMKFANQQVVVAESRTFDAKLEVGTTTEIVEVHAAEGTELQTTNASVGNTITGVSLDALPSLGRDVSTFVTLQPGVSPDGSVGGANQDQNSFMLDGGNNSSDMDGTMNTYTPSFAGDPTGGLVNNEVTGTAPGGSSGGGGPTGVLPTPADSVEEFRVVTNNQTADFNSSAGAQVQLVTKRGTNQWHGTAYEYYLNNNWSANGFDNNASGTPLPVFHYNRFGGAVGGPVISKEILGGKTYFFANYEGFRWGNKATLTRAVPSPGMELGLLQFGGTVYNLNPYGVTYPSDAPAIGALVPGTTYAANAGCAGLPGGACDPRGLGISPTVQQMWQQYEPASNTSTCGSLSRCDHLNVLAFRKSYPLPWKDNFGVARLDHDFGKNWHFNSTYRFYKMERATSNQVDIGGFFSGDKLGEPASRANRPQQPWYYTASLTTNITANLTNDFHYSYLRNYWARASNAQPPQIDGLGGALEPNGESSTNVLAPYNLDTQNVRTRFWDGQDHMIRDDVSWAKGNHFFQFGGLYQHNWNYHQRTDNGGGINYQTVYWLGSSVGSTNGMDMSLYTPDGLGSSWKRDYGIVLGVPGVTQIAYTRTGSNLTLNPPNTPAFDQSTIPFYNLYANDSWRISHSFTLNYGLGWTLEMPPTEAQGKQIAVVDANNKIIDTAQYLKNRENAALQGQVYNPEIGFTLIHNVDGHPKYLYDPYYKSFSPRIAAAWNPNFDSGILHDVFGSGKTVVRGGFSILYGRLNGVDLVLVPLLGTGLIQAVQCVSPLANGQCGGPGGATPATSFRIGPTAAGFNGLVAPLPAASQTLSQPDYPGINEIAAGAGEGIDPKFRPSMNKQFDITIQRQFGPRISIEVGYIGRWMNHEFQPLNMNAVPYMMTQGGQRFDKAYGQMVWQYCGGASGLAGGGCAGNLAAVTAQPFFETALGGTGSPYCAGFASCTAAVAANEGNAGTNNIAQANVWSLWSDLDKGAFTFPRSMLNTPIDCPTPPGTAIGCDGQLSSGIGMNTSFGYGNYNGGFFSVKMNNWHGLTLQSNFTFSKALGTGSQVQATSQYTISDPYYFGRNYGLQPWDRKFLFNTFIVYQPPFFQNQQGVLGHILGGWTIAPIIDIGSGLPLFVAPADAFANELYQGGQAFGEADAANFGAQQNAINMCSPGVGGSSRHNNPIGGDVYGTSGFGPNQFQDPGAVYSCFRNPILGIDEGHNGAAGQLRGLPFWNVDLSVKKNLKLTERFSTELSAVFTNVLNHNQMGDPLLILGDQGDWGGLGTLPGVGQVNNPRKIELGLRIRF